MAKEKTKSISLIGGSINEWCWNIIITIIDNGSFHNKGKIVLLNYTEQDNERRQYKRDKKAFDRAILGMGCCLFCNELDFRVLEEHHIDKEKLPNFTITLCANCHRKLHWMYPYLNWKEKDMSGKEIGVLLTRGELYLTHDDNWIDDITIKLSD